MAGRRIGVFVALLGACANLPALEHETCGNGVVEQGEDCDGATDPLLGAQLACTPATAAAACRYTCVAASCPAGWACGEDGVCRHGTGELIARMPFALPHADLVLADVDGVHGNEVVGFGELGAVVAFGETTVRAALLDRLAGPGAAADLDGDARADIVAPFALGVIVSRGEPDQTLTSIGYAPFDATAEAWYLPVRVPRLDAPPNPDALALLSLASGGTRAELRLVPDPTLQPGVQLAPETTPNALGPLAIRADLDAPSAADELVIAALGEPHVWIVHGELAGISIGTAITEIRIPVERGVSDGRVAAGDLDGDGDLDLLLGTLTANGFDIAAAINDGGLAFSVSDAPSALATLAQPGWAVDGVPSAPQRFPLALGDLDGDGVLDAVSPDAVFLMRAGMLEPVYRRASLTPWREAIIANVDRGQPDVIVTSGGAGLGVLRQGSTGFTATIVDSAGAVTNLRAGDFDGDGIRDVAFRERLASSDRLRVVFGGDGVLGPASVVTRAASILRHEVGRFATREGNFDAADELVAIVREADRTRAAFIIGAGDRRMRSPLFLVAAGRQDTPLGAVAGRFLPNPLAGHDLVVLAERSGSGVLWVFRSTPGAAYSAPDAGLLLHPAFDRFALRRLAAADLDGDGTDQLVAVGIATSGATQLVIVDLATGPPVVSAVDLDIGEPLDLAAGDLDRDGRAELVILGTTGAAVLRGGVIEPLALTGTSLCLAQLDGDPAPELVVLSSTITIREAADLATPTTALAAPPGATVIRGGDVDGDGIADVVVGDGLSVTRLLTQPHVPIER